MSVRGGGGTETVRRCRVSPFILAGGVLPTFFSLLLIPVGCKGETRPPDTSKVDPNEMCILATEPAQGTPSAAPATERPPQFITVSFDGGGSLPNWQYWRKVAQDTGARFTFFLSGVYMLTPANRRLYQPPRRRAGVSDIGFLPVPRGQKPNARLASLLHEIDHAYAEGHEIGSHLNGHGLRVRPRPDTSKLK